MFTRRQFTATPTALGASSMLAACAPWASRPGYEEAIREVWRHGQVDRSDGPALPRELVRHATLAPSSHNTQGWKFTTGDKRITIAPDPVSRLGRGPTLPPSLRRPVQSGLT